MKQDLWLVNSSLLALFAFFMLLYLLLEQKPPLALPIRKQPLLEVEAKKILIPSAQKWEKIYHDDLFSTYISRKLTITKKSFVTPIPEPRPPAPTPPPLLKKQEFIAPLNLSLRGIIVGSDEARSVAMIVDETKKEGLYHIGEKIKDAQIIKIVHNRIVLLRANGQQEVYILRHEEPVVPPVPEKWKYIVKKINNQTYEVDLKAFSKEIETLGNFIDRASVIGSAYQGGRPIGIRIGKLTKNSIVPILGLMENDIITSINNLSLSETKNRIKVYDNITKLSKGSIVKVGLKRAAQDLFLSYKLATLEQPAKLTFPGVQTGQPAQQTQAGSGVLNKMSRLQRREQSLREFERHHHPNTQRNTTMMEIRKRILDNLRNRNQNTRFRR